MKGVLSTIAGPLLLFIFCDKARTEPCFKNVSTCVPVNATMCLTSKITFSHTSLLYTNNSMDQEEINKQLEVWKHLQAVPECWSIVQPFLCSVYLPKCDSVKQRVELPNRELCQRVKAPCEVVKRYNNTWPWFMDCQQWFYAESCGQTVYETTNFDTLGICHAPLIRTDEEATWYDSIKGCGMQCENPLYTSHDHRVVRVLVAVLAAVCFLSSIFTIVTFVLDWRVARKYPAVILFYINVCLFIAMLGWLLQFVVTGGVLCRKDGTIRRGEPLIGTGETASCTVVFMLIYYFTLAAVVWFVMLGYSWEIHFKALGSVRDDLSKKTAYFHIISWCLPLVLTIICLSTSVIDADSLSGICFPGFDDIWVRTGYVLAPISIATVTATFFSIRGLHTLRSVRRDSPPFIGERATAKIHDTIIRLGVFIILTCTVVVTSVGIHIYNFVSVTSWNDSLMQYTYCQANVSVMQIMDGAAPSSCVMESRPSVVAAVVHIFMFFGASLVFSSWSWTQASIDVWRRTWRRLCNKPINKPAKMRAHRLRARRFKRGKQRSNERLSISYGTDHDDPVGLRFDRSSMSSHSRSSGFSVSVPKHGRRLRGGVLPSHLRRSHRRHAHSDADAGSQGSRNGSSRSSNRQSYESSMSQKLSDIERQIREEERKKRRKKKRRKRHQNRIQPILAPLASNMVAMSGRRLQKLGERQRRSDTSDVSKMSGYAHNDIAVDKNHYPMQNMSPLGTGTSNILSDSAMSENSNSVSEIEMPMVIPRMPDFSIFTAASALPPVEAKDGTDGNVNATVHIKGGNPSPSGSVRRGRRREVKLEMTETSFYQEDEENIEIGGNQTIHTEENCHELGEVRGNFKELGPLVNEMFEHARASSGNGRSSRQRDAMGSSRLGSASSRGSRSSRGSQVNSKDLKYATGKVNLPPEVPRPDTDRTARKRPFSGDYVLVSRRNNMRNEDATRKSQSQPGSRVSSATSNHKRQIGNNGKSEFKDGMSWSRFLQGKGYPAGQPFGPIADQQRLAGEKADFYNSPLLTEDARLRNLPPYSYSKGQAPYSDHLLYTGSNPYSGQQQTGQVPAYTGHQISRPTTNPGQLQIMDKSHLETVTAEIHATEPQDSQPQTVPADVLNIEHEHENMSSKTKPPADVLNIEQEHRKLYTIKRPYTNPYRKHRDPSEGDVLANEEELEQPECPSGKDSSINPDLRRTYNILNVEAEHCEGMGPDGSLVGTVNVLDVTAEQLQKPRADVVHVPESELEAKSKRQVNSKHQPHSKQPNSKNQLNSKQPNSMNQPNSEHRPNSNRPQPNSKKPNSKEQPNSKHKPNSEQKPNSKHQPNSKNQQNSIRQPNSENQPKHQQNSKNQPNSNDHENSVKQSKNLGDKAAVNADILDIEAEHGQGANESQSFYNHNDDFEVRNNEMSGSVNATVRTTSDDNDAKYNQPQSGSAMNNSGSPTDQNIEHRHVLLSPGHVDAHKISAFDGSGSNKNKRNTSTKYALKDSHIPNATGAVVLSKPLPSATRPTSKVGQDEKFVGPGSVGPGPLKTLQQAVRKQNGVIVNGREAKKIHLKGKQGAGGKSVKNTVNNENSVNDISVVKATPGNTGNSGGKSTVIENVSENVAASNYNPSSTTVGRTELDSRPVRNEQRNTAIGNTGTRSLLGSEGTSQGSSGSRSTSVITRSSSLTRHSDCSDDTDDVENFKQNIEALNKGFTRPNINENFYTSSRAKENRSNQKEQKSNPKEQKTNPKDKSSSKEKSSSRSKALPERSVGMFDFVDCDTFESDYDDVSTDNLTDTYTCTDDDLTEVSSLPC